MRVACLIACVVLSGCVPSNVVIRSYFKAVGIYRFEVYEFGRDPVKDAKQQGKPLNSRKYPVDFRCLSVKGDSSIQVTLVGNKTKPYQLEWSVPDPVLDTAKLHTNQARKAVFHTRGELAPYPSRFDPAAKPVYVPPSFYTNSTFK